MKGNSLLPSNMHSHCVFKEAQTSNKLPVWNITKKDFIWFLFKKINNIGNCVDSIHTFQGKEVHCWISCFNCTWRSVRVEVNQVGLCGWPSHCTAVRQTPSVTSQQFSRLRLFVCVWSHRSATFRPPGRSLQQTQTLFFSVQVSLSNTLEFWETICRITSDLG